MSDSKRHTNRLSLETSPYLLQHQHNPVDWFPWSDQAFERARAENKPIFLSVGYSSCYWCHVMERESFESENIARVMNEHFVNIKLDREERPDVDQLYMTALQLLTSQGGWPMSVWLTPDLRPFYAGTYFPPDDRYGRPGFSRLCEAIGEAWRDRRDQVEDQASKLIEALKQLSTPKSRSDESTSFDLSQLIDQSVHDFDVRNGGFGHAPKFPRQTLLAMIEDCLASDRSEVSSKKTSLESMLARTLDAMANGGIRDHLGGAFHRYSTDAKWLVPHFEIMLYDQALLAPIYARAATLLKNDRYERVARGVCDFVLREMTSDDGTFFSAFDAEAEAREGSTYLWMDEQIDEVLGSSSSKLKEVYGVNLGKNFADPHHDQGVASANVLYLPHGAEFENDPDIVEARAKLLEARKMRAQPSLDRKILTAWNALMIDGLATCAIELNEPRYRDAAARCADYILLEHVESDADLLHSSFNGQAKGLGNLDDYAFTLNALLTLTRATNDRRWHDAATRLVEPMVQRFSDYGAMFFSDERATDLIVRQKITSDSPLPSGNAIASRVLDKLDWTRKSEHGAGAGGVPTVAPENSPGKSIAQSILSDCSDLIRRAPESHSAMISSLLDIEESNVTQSDVRSNESGDEHVKVEAKRAGKRRIDVIVKIASGFHVYDSDVDPRHGLTATRLYVQTEPSDPSASIEYPPAELLELPYGPAVAGYTGRVEIVVRFGADLPERPINLSLSYQVCDDKACLMPSVARVVV